MGYLMNQGSQIQRSYGFELRTNEWGSVRADKGLLITTYTQDFKQRIAHDSPDGHEQMGATLAQSKSLVQATEQAVNSTKDVLTGIVQNRGTQYSTLATALPGIPAAAQAIAATVLGGDTSESGETSVSGDMDPAMADAQAMLGLSRQIEKPIVSIVSPEGQTMISPKPVVVSSGQSISIRASSPMTLTTGAQLTQLAQRGMVTQVSTGGQVNVVSGGDIISHAQTGATNIIAQNDASITSTSANANVVGEKSALLQGKTKDAFVMGGERVALICGRSSIVLLADGTVQISGVKGLFNFTEDLDERGGKIYLNCDAPVAMDSSVVANGQNLVSAASQPMQPANGDESVGSASTSVLSPPATPEEAPNQVDLSHLQGQFDSLWGQSFPNGKSQEFGGTLVSDKDGNIKLVNTGGGTSGTFSPDLNVGADEKVLGVFHTHPYDNSEGGHTGVSLSGGDAGYLINKKQDVIIAQSGTQQFMYMRTGQTPDSVNFQQLNAQQNQRIGEIARTQNIGFSQASQIAAQETAASHGLAYYEGQDGIFTKK
jgi:rhs element vgr protein